MKESAKPVPPHKHDADLTAYVNRTIGLAKEVREQQAEPAEVQYLQLDFNKILRTSARWILVNDIIALLAAFVCGGLTAWGIHELFGTSVFQDIYSRATVQQFAIYLSFCALGLIWLDSHGHYRQRLPYWELLGHIITVATFGFVASGFIQFAMKDDTSRLWIGLSWLFFFVFVFTGRSFVRHRLDLEGAWKIPALIIGKGSLADRTRRALTRDKQMGFTIIGQLSPFELDNMLKPEAWKHLMVSRNACHVFLALEGGEIERHQAALKALTRARLPCSIVPPWLGLPSSTLSPHHFMMQDVMLLHDTNKLQLLLPGVLKRLFDIVVSGSMLTVLSPLLLGVALWVRRDGGPAFFKQKRVGKDGSIFECYKFRSMRVDAEMALAQYLAQNPEAAQEWLKYQKLKNDVRITTFGHFIRRTSIDELPQLFNVLKGDMSLVGPRPCMLGQEELYDEDFSFYKSVRPGITGPWQVSGRNELTFKERVSLEAWYVRNWNLWTDIVIMLKTVPTVLGREKAF